jgi:hypothetical protein
MKNEVNKQLSDFQIGDKVYWIADEKKPVMVVHAIDEDTQMITCQFKDNNGKFDTAVFHYLNLVKI